jgi:hypothetical protein
VLRGPNPSELEADLAKIERRLTANGDLSSQERRLRNLYYTHLRNRFRSILVGLNDAQTVASKQLDTSTPVQQRHAEGTDDFASPINQIEPSDESWKIITSTGLIRAVTNVRKDFEKLSFAQHRFFGDKCFKDLHPLALGLTEPLVFKKHFWDCVGALCKVVPFVFGRFLDLSLNQNGPIGEAPIEWAALQVTDLIEHEDRHVNGWIKSACDPRSDVDRRSAGESWEEILFWTDWRAPKWLLMTPNGNSRYDPSTAWDRLDEAETARALKYLRESRWILLLEGTLEKLVGTAHEVLAKNSSRLEPQQRPAEPGSPSGGPPLTDYTFLRQGNVWSIAYSGKTCLIPHQVGLEYIARLLQNQGHPMTALGLRFGTNSEARTGARSLLQEMQTSEDGPPQRVHTSDGRLWQERSDATAQAEYRKRAKELESEIEEARARGDQNEVDKLLRDLDMIVDSLGADTGLRGRRRRFSDDAEKARLAVTNAINRAIEAIRKQAPAIADHLQNNIKTGTELVYRDAASVWRVSTS